LIDISLIISWLGALLGVGGAIFIIFKKRIAFIICNLSNALLLFKAMEIKDYSNMTIFLAYFIVNSIAYIKWKK
jgi:nicotinamide riboside transporter PnuC